MKSLDAFPDAHLRIFERPEPPPDPDSVYLIGICGTGMGSLAGLFQQAGKHVSGSDAAVYPPMSTRLAAQHIEVYEGFNAERLPGMADLYVVGNACTPTHVEASWAREHRVPQVSLPEALSRYFIRDRRSLVVAGTHGKTTTTSLLTHVLQSAGLDPGFMVGGVMNNGNASFSAGTGRHFIVEGDEYDSAYFDKRPKFMHYRPVSAIVTSLEFDHADIYETMDDYREAFRALVGLVPGKGLLMLNADDEEVRALANGVRARIRFYGLENEHADITARDIRPGNGGIRFTPVVNGKGLGPMFLNMSGRHNLMNALSVLGVCLDEGVSARQIGRAFASFEGIRRRQQIRGEERGVIVVDDFAHHPTAVRATLEATRERWPDRRLVAVFEPRSNSSRRKVFETGYAEAFRWADALFLSTPPFRHNDDPSNFMDVGRVLDDVRCHGTDAFQGLDADALLPMLLRYLKPGDVALIMSNGSFGGIHGRLLEALATN
ncbi:MAG: UDP-N-acetylmuramate:L-alanyl-gamma-D-glutamyl-meso-diaminopimelate ligase [Bacteroidetes bacterium CG12_big_fil_rev_8_21_14_0_65_60_17]|nr:MAG: UDP-N-acetylmuramate:L-alanyl-gamma-D-glutamyl-meso-diaminopimelate ligase [Bacteroidetes bacterium CG12_big_fil_rev_8_21_14_0_65_60_17]